MLQPGYCQSPTARNVQVEAMKKTTVTLLVLTFPSCASPLYDWGNYENSIYRMTVEGAAVQGEIPLIEGDIERTQSKGKLVPPGKFAYLGYLYAESGNSQRARECFESEKELYPESGRFIDGLLTRIK